MRRAPCGYTVPMYADGCELLVFRTFSQSVSVPKRVFRHAGLPLTRELSAKLTEGEKNQTNFALSRKNRNISGFLSLRQNLRFCHPLIRERRETPQTVISGIP